MSNPVAAGAATVVRDFYNKAHGLNASAALVKATLINSAVDLRDENNDGADDNDFPIPNMHEGWGRVNVANATDGSPTFVESAGVSTNGSAGYSFSVNTTKPVKVSLVWSDYPSTESAGKNLVNDLDLRLTSPSGAVYLGNVFGGGWSQTGGSADRTNNVENIYINSAVTGSWTVEVRGFNVPNGPQPFALVVDGADSSLSPVAPPHAPSIHIGDLDGTGAKNGNGWKATVTITVHDANHQPISNAGVGGRWSYSSSTVSCTTGSNGQCSIASSRISRNSSSVDFTVTGISHSSSSYDSGANHDPEGIAAAPRSP
jgi:hypothetical protein